VANCTYESRKPTDKSDQPCLFDIEQLKGTPCTLENNYGYEEGSPCILLKLNKIFEWVPKPFADAKFLDGGEYDDGVERENVPEALKQRVARMETSARKEDKEQVGRIVWVHCEGENPADKEAIGKVSYYPSQGWPDFYFPFKNQDFYLQPFVFAHFENPLSETFLL